MVYPVWPNELDNDTWQKKKGKVAKIAGKTGIGDAIKASFQLFEKLKFADMEASHIATKDRDVETLNNKREEANRWYSTQVEATRTKLKALRDAAKKTADSWAKNKLMPKEATAAAREIENSAEQVWMALKSNSDSMSPIFEHYDRMIKIAQDVEVTERKKVDDNIKNLKAALTAVTKDLTKSGWESSASSPHQRCRSMNNCIKAIPSLKKKFGAEWNPYGDFYAKNVEAGSKTEQQDVLALVKKVYASLKTFEATYQTYM